MMDSPNSNNNREQHVNPHNTRSRTSQAHNRPVQESLCTHCSNRHPDGTCPAPAPVQDTGADDMDVPSMLRCIGQAGECVIQHAVDTLHVFTDAHHPVEHKKSELPTANNVELQAVTQAEQAVRQAVEDGAQMQGVPVVIIGEKINHDVPKLKNQIKCVD